MDSVNTNAGMTPADIAAVMGNGNNQWGNEGGAWWLLVLFLFMFMGMGNNGWNNNPPPNNAPLSADIQRGFDQSATSATLAGLGAQVGNGFSDAAVARCNAQQNLLQTLNANQMNMQQSMSDLRFTVAQENCNDRQTFNNGMNNLMAQNTANTYAIINSQQEGFRGLQDKLCQMEIDNLKTTNEQLRQQLNMANLSASQIQQTAQIVQQNEAQTAQLIQRIAPMPVPAYTVTNPWTGTTTSTATAS